MPTSLSCSQGGKVVAVAFTDEKIRIIDFRVKQTLAAISGDGSDRATMTLEGEHSDLIKKI